MSIEERVAALMRDGVRRTRSEIADLVQCKRTEEAALTQALQGLRVSGRRFYVPQSAPPPPPAKKTHTRDSLRSCAESFARIAEELEQAADDSRVAAAAETRSPAERNLMEAHAHLLDGFAARQRQVVRRLGGGL